MNSPLFRAPLVVSPDSAIGFKYVTDVTKFEDVVAPLVEPEYDQAEWQARTHVRHLVTPDSKIFQGNLHDITLTVLEDPIGQFLNAKEERGRKFGQGYNFYIRMAKLIKEDSALLARCLGFTFRAVASSTRRANITPVEVDIWYLPDPREPKITGKGSGGRELLRPYTKPEYDINALKAVHNAASRMGAVAAQQRRRNPMQAARGDRSED